MDFDAGNTSDPATAQACGSDTLEDSGDNNEPMQAGIPGASDKSEEAVPTDGQFQSPPSDEEDELQGATAAIVRSAEIPPVKPLEATATVDSVLALQGSFREEHERLRRQLGEQWSREDRERKQRRESEMQEGDVQPQQQQLAVPACSQQKLKYRKEDFAKTGAQFQSPPSDRNELQGATAAIDPGGSAEESASAVEQVINDSCSSLDQVLLELELIRRSVVQGQQPRREIEMQECEVQPQQQPQQLYPARNMSKNLKKYPYYA